MKLALDTNVLVRYLVWDDKIQSKKAAQAIESATLLFVSTIVLCETVWVLRRVYKHSPQEISTVLHSLIETENIETDRTAAQAGLAALEKGGDFADGVIQFEAGKAKMDFLVTFDKSFAGNNKSTPVKQL